MNNKTLKFEAAIKQIEIIVEKLENNEIELDEAIKLFEQGFELCNFCSKKLDEAKKKIQILVDSKNGEKELQDFDENFKEE